VDTIDSTWIQGSFYPNKLGTLNVEQVKADSPVKSQKSDDKVNSFRCKARKYEGMRRTYLYAAMTEDAAQRSRWTFYEVVKVDLYVYGKARETGDR
jgi:hypothetical protein